MTKKFRALRGDDPLITMPLEKVQRIVEGLFPRPVRLDMEEEEGEVREGWYRWRRRTGLLRSSGRVS